MSDRIYFISDIHLQLFDSEQERIKKNYLSEFLEDVKSQKGELYIIGDLFDFWFEYKYVIPKHFFKQLREIQAVIESGCRVSLIVGNHDYWAGNFLKNEIGINIYYEPLEIDISNKRFLLIHGDGILENDKGYRFLKRVIRNRFFISLFRFLHPDLGFAIAKKISKTSRNSTLRKPEVEELWKNETIGYGKSKFKEGFDYVIMGHYHIPIFYKEGKNVFMNLGDWMKYFTFGYFDGKCLSLHYWNTNLQSKK
jgi:UDP-2,3-diacylglucosamine hydrolase